MRRIASSIGPWIVTLAVVGTAIVVAASLWKRVQQTPWTRDGHVRADVIRVSTDVGGLVTQVAVHDNQAVKAGQLLIILDRPRIAAAIEQADAAIASAEANLDQARKEARRDLVLGDLVAAETHEQNVAHVRTASAALAGARADRNVANVNMQRTEIRATVDGTVTNLDIHPGDYLSTGAQAMALIDTSSVRVEGYFEETKLQHVVVGEEAHVRLMGDDQDMIGHVESIAAGIADDQRTDGNNLLPKVAPTFTWVRLAQRIPVRIHIDRVPSGTKLIIGRSATVSIVQPDTPDRKEHHL
jgi:RND family efflux transporter MFP subunit